MKIFKKNIYLIALAALLLFTSCSYQPKTHNSSDNSSFMILCTTFPQYDWVKNITAGISEVDVKYLLESGTDLHNFQPSAEDIVNINKADLFIYVGGSSDYTIAEILNKSDKDEASSFNMMSCLGENLLIEEDAEHTHNSVHNHNTSDYDEHIWLSLKNAATICSSLSDKLCELLPQFSDIIKSNAQTYIAEITQLDAAYSEKISKCSKSQLVIADKFPLIYLANDYSLECFKAFSGCSSETDAGFGKILELSSKVDEYNLNYVISLENSNTDIAKSVIENTTTKNQQILYINSLQSVTKDDINNGITYISAMSENLNVIVKALTE